MLSKKSSSSIYAATAFVASDLMPPEVGSGSFWKEMMNLAVEGPGYVDTALDNIQKSWP